MILAIGSDRRTNDGGIRKTRDAAIEGYTSGVSRLQAGCYCTSLTSLHVTFGWLRSLGKVHPAALLRHIGSR